MPLLHMETEEARSVASLLQQYTATMDGHSRQLHGSRSRLESGWQSNAATVFLGELDQALSRAGALSREGDALARRLSAEIAEWEAADASLGGSGTTGFRMGLIPIYEILPWPPGSLGIRFRPDPGFPGGFSGGGGGGGGGGAWGADDPMPGVIDIDTEYSPFGGGWYKVQSRYRAGEMTWNELVKNLEEMEKSTRPEYIDKKLTLLEIAKREGSWSGSLMDNTITGQYGQVDAGLGRAAADGEASLDLKKDGLAGKLEGTGGLYAIHGKANSQVAGVDMASQAFLGVQGKGELGATIDPAHRNASIKGGADLFGGMKAEGSLEKKDLGIDGLDVGMKGAAMVGAGVVLKGEAGIKDGVLKLDYDAGLAWGIGGQIGFSVELNVFEAANDIARNGLDAIDFSL